MRAALACGRHGDDLRSDRLGVGLDRSLGSNGRLGNDGGLGFDRSLGDNGGLRTDRLGLGTDRGGRVRALVSVARGGGLALVADADDLLVAVAGLAGLVLAVVTLADEVLPALVTVALLVGALVAVADDLLVAALAVALCVLAVVAVADDEAVVVLLLTLLGPALVVLADDAVAGALLAVVLGDAVVSVADDLLAVPVRGGLGALGLGDGVDLDGLVAERAVGDGGRALCDGVRARGSVCASGSDLGVRDVVVLLGDALVDGQENVAGDAAAAAEVIEATALLLVVTGALLVAVGEINTAGLVVAELVTAVAVPG